MAADKNPTRLQMIARPWGSGERLDRPYDSQRWHEASPKLPMALVNGVLEVPAGLLRGEQTLPLSLVSVNQGVAWIATCGRPSELDEDTQYEAQTAGLSHMLTTKIWRLPETMTNQRSLGSIMVRRCTLEAEPGREAYLFVGIVLGDVPALDTGRPRFMQGEGTLVYSDLTYAGLLGMRLVDHPNRAPLMPKLGDAPDEVFRLPNWGWGPEPVGFAATMTPDACVAMDERANLFDRLSEGGLLTDEEHARIREIHATYGFGGTPEREYQTFRRLLRRVHDHVGVSMPPSGQPRTALQIEQLENWSDLIIREIMSEYGGVRSPLDLDGTFAAVVEKLEATRLQMVDVLEQGSAPRF